LFFIIVHYISTNNLLHMNSLKLALCHPMLQSMFL